MASTQKELKELLKAARKQGWRVKEGTKGLMLYAPGGEGIVSVHKTPTDHRALMNTVTRMRRYGFEWKGR